MRDVIISGGFNLYPGVAASEDEIVGFAKLAVGSVKAPKRVLFYDDLPRSGVGEVLRRDVRERELALRAER